jgi:hypothetical protein
MDMLECRYPGLFLAVSCHLAGRAELKGIQQAAPGMGRLRLIVNHYEGDIHEDR